MRVSELMSKNLISISSNDTISAALAKMKKYRIHQLPVIDDKKLSGMVILKNIISRDIDPATAKVCGVVVHTPVLRQDYDLKKAVELLLQSGMRALPVVEGNDVTGILSETDMMKIVANSKVNYKIEDVMSECEYVTKDDNLGKVKKIMTYKNVSRVPVLDDGKIVGIIGTLELINAFLKGKQRFGGRADTKDRGYKEPLSVDKLPVKIFMRAPVMVDKNMGIMDASKIFLKNEEILVYDKEKLYILTPKDVLELFEKGAKRGVYVQITGLGDEDEFTVAKIDASVTSFVQKIGKMVRDLQSFTLHIERHSPGGRIKYSVRTRLLTPLGLFVSKAWKWELATATQEAMNKLEREILKKCERIKTHEAEKRSKMLRRRM